MVGHGSPYCPLQRGMGSICGRKRWARVGARTLSGSVGDGGSSRSAEAVLQRRLCEGAVVRSSVGALLRMFQPRGVSQDPNGRSPNSSGRGLIVVNSITVERPYGDQDRGDGSGDGGVYADSEGMVTMCCHCRKTLRANQLAVWDWVPVYVKSPPTQVSHGLCSICVNLHYPDFMAGG